MADKFFIEDFCWTGGSIGTIEGREAYKEVIQQFWAGLPEARATEEDILDAEDAVVARFTVSGTHSGELWASRPREGR